MDDELLPEFAHNTFIVRRKIFKIFGASFHIYDTAGNVVGFSSQKAFKLKEDIRLYTGEDKQSEVLRIKARGILDISPIFDVVDSITDAKIGALKRRGLKSILKDEWLFLDENDREIGSIKEDSMILALGRRFVANIIPQNFTGAIGGVPVCEFRQDWNPFLGKITLDFSMDRNGLLDRRLGIAAAILLCAIEGQQK